MTINSAAATSTIEWREEFGKVNSVQEACANNLRLKFEILQTTWKDKTKNIKMAKTIGEKLKTKGRMFFLSFFSNDLQDFIF